MTKLDKISPRITFYFQTKIYFGPSMPINKCRNDGYVSLNILSDVESYKYSPLILFYRYDKSLSISITRHIRLTFYSFVIIVKIIKTE